VGHESVSWGRKSLSSRIRIFSPDMMELFQYDISARVEAGGER
jgi:hypothetical protein